MISNSTLSRKFLKDIPRCFMNFHIVWLIISPREAGNSKQSHFQMGMLRAFYLVEHHSNRTKQHLEIFLAVVSVGCC